MSGKMPAFLFYADKFMQGATLLTPEQRGCLISLLCYCWDKGSFPDDRESICIICNMKDKNYDKIMPKVIQKFTKNESGEYYNIRLEEERVKSLSKREKLSKNANMRWQKDMQNESKSNAIAYPVEEDLDMPDKSITITNTITTISKDIEKGDTPPNPQPPVLETQKKEKEKKSSAKRKEKPPLDYTFMDTPENEVLKPAFRKWVRYKKSEFNKEYKSQESLEAAFNKLKKYSGGNADKAMEVVDNALAGQWMGIRPLEEPKQYSSPAQQQPFKAPTLTGVVKL